MGELAGWLRLIPARAGNTASGMKAPSLDQAHPRSRGEHSAITASAGSTDGSSPLARGTRPLSLVCGLCRRLIPARAGNTFLTSLRMRKATAHPRSRGEHSCPHASKKNPYGSSPLARGTRKRTGKNNWANRLIPARAGNTPKSSIRASRISAHPRSRGEHTC